ncbi:hypothetical protein [Methyloradius palustris]|uniref:Uncharacterized protein n=1 Tax=Methyloradius palustris TaxID=2778876 RepID=A0A8D5G0B7_9PROT|nr:hypothetical protein [Methyloradius palustris]BCM25487.1 hypothetical protein ZMTM_17460 [Methyloradius palustris]
MTENTSPHTFLTFELAQHILHTLAERNLLPTPVNYQSVYEELTGEPGDAASGHQELMMDAPLGMARRLAKTSTDLGLRLALAIEDGDWTRFSDEVVKFVSLPAETKPKSTPFSDFGEDNPSARLWRELLSKMLISTIPSLLEHDTELAKTSEYLAHRLKNATSKQEVIQLSSDLKSLDLHIGLYTDDMAAKHKAFLRMLDILFDSLVGSDQVEPWLVQEIRDFQQILHQPLDEKQLVKAAQYLRDMVLKTEG